MGAKEGLLGTTNIIEYEAAYKKMREREQRDSVIIGALASDYSSVYYIDLETEEIVPYSMNDATENAFGETFRRGIKYSEAFQMYVERFVAEVDKSRMMNAGAMSNIISQLSVNKSFSTTYLNYKKHYCEMKFVGVGEPGKPKYVALGFANRDNEQRSEQQYMSVIRGLAEDFALVEFVDIDTERSYIYRFDKNYKRYFTGWDNVETFGERLDVIMNCVVAEEDREEFFTATRKAVILRELRKAPAYFVNFRCRLDGEIEYWQIKFVLTDTDPINVVAGFHSVDSEMKQQMMSNEVLERNLNIIKVLASEYSSVLYIDLKTESFTPYSMNENMESEFGRIFRSGIRYSDAYELYVRKKVIEPDRELMLETGSVRNIREELAGKKSFAMIYRDGNDSNPHFCEVKFVKVDEENEEPTAVALAFADRDIEIGNRYVNEKLREDYSSIYMVDLENDYIRSVVSSGDGTRRTIYKTSSYSQQMSNYSRLVAEEYRETWENISKVRYMRQFLAEDDRREYIYRMSGQDSEWKRATFRVLNRRFGVPTSFVLSFMTIDNARAEKLELDAKIMEQKLELESQQRMLAMALSRAEAANNAKTTFLSNMSHDIRTPMNAIMGFTELALQTVDDPLKVKDYLQKTEISSKHLMSLINDILDMSRIESGKMNLEESGCDLLEVVEDVKTIIQVQAQDANLRLDMDDVELVERFVVCDRLRLQQVLINLLSNAVKFTPGGGYVRFALHQLTNFEALGTYEFVVSDTGVGMSPEFIEKIFEPFERERTSTISKTQGTGLGMAISKKIVDMMGGNIKVKSEIGMGSEFTVSLTFRIQDRNEGEIEAERARAEHKMLSELDFTGRTVLLVEDNELNREIASTLLEGCGMKVDCAENGLIAVDMVRAAGADPYDVILMDAQMPVMDGYDATRNIRMILDEKLSSIPIIAMTANAFAEDRAMALAAGMNDHVSKPIDIDQLKKTLGKYIMNQ